MFCSVRLFAVLGYFLSLAAINISPIVVGVRLVLDDSIGGSTFLNLFVWRCCFITQHYINDFAFCFLFFLEMKWPFLLFAHFEIVQLA